MRGWGGPLNPPPLVCSDLCNNGDYEKGESSTPTPTRAPTVYNHVGRLRKMSIENTRDLKST